MNQIKIFLVDDHQMFLDGIVGLIKSNEHVDVVGTANSADDALKRVKNLKPEMVITDVNMPGMKGPALISKLKQEIQGIKIIALSMHHEKHIVNDVLKSGADGYVLKTATQDELLEAIEKVNKGEVFVSASITKMLVDSVKYPAIEDLLSDREMEIIQLIVQEKTNKQIGELLFISEKTVETHKRNIFRKTHSNTAVGLTKFAIEHNLV